MNYIIDQFNSQFKNKNFTEKEIIEYLAKEKLLEYKLDILNCLQVVPVELNDGNFVFIRRSNPDYININYIQVCNMILELEELRKGDCNFDSNFTKVMSELGNSVRINYIPYE
jgi:hypothetical protein